MRSWQTALSIFPCAHESIGREIVLLGDSFLREAFFFFSTKEISRKYLNVLCLYGNKGLHLTSRLTMKLLIKIILREFI